MSPKQRVILRRRLVPLIISGCASAALGIVMAFVLLTAPGGPLPIPVAVSLLFLLTLGVLGFASSLFLAIPFTVEAEEEGLRSYRRGQLRRNLSWSDVTWIAFGHWSVPVVLTLARKTALCLFVRARKVRKSIGMDDVVYKVSADEVTEFANAVVQMANARSIPVLPRPRFRSLS